MSEPVLNILAVTGSLKKESVTRVVIRHAAAAMTAAGCAVDILELLEEPLPLFNPDSARSLPGFPALQARVAKADVFLLGTPDYHGGMSGAMKNFLDHFWQEFAGKLFVPVVASHEKGLTVIDDIRTTARQCYAWTLPYGVSFIEKGDVQSGKVVSDGLLQRLEMTTRDATVYGRLLARQRRADLAGTDAGFLAKHRR
ncbi:MAG: NAD(P)H-dependent oxidoreductase [Verrucomicrobiota bacterium]